MNRYEQQIQRDVFRHIRARSMPGVVAFHVPNGGFRRRTEAAILKGLGVTPGIPDVIAIHRGAIHALELKHLRGKVTPAQKATMDALELAGVRTAVAYTLDEALAALERWGILRRDRSRPVSHETVATANPEN